jgi:hypothetical protein
MPWSDPAKRREHQRKKRAEKRASLGLSSGGALPVTPCEPILLRTPKDVLTALQESLNAVRADAEAGPQVKARSVGYLMAIALKALEVADMAERLATVETMLREAGYVVPVAVGKGTVAAVKTTAAADNGSAGQLPPRSGEADDRRGDGA